MGQVTTSHQSDDIKCVKARLIQLSPLTQRESNLSFKSVTSSFYPVPEAPLAFFSGKGLNNKRAPEIHQAD